MNRAIHEAKKLINYQVTNQTLCTSNKLEAFTNYQKGYCWTNENIAAYINMCRVGSNSSALTVLASGDHAFNLIAKGIIDVDTFDINYLAEYIALGLKRAMILKYDYFEFIGLLISFKTSTTSLEEITDIINGLLPYMEANHKAFWQSILNYNYKIQKNKERRFNLIHLLCTGIYSPKFNLYNNYYLLDAYCYEQLKINLNRANITFRHADAINLPEIFKGKTYDLILLSNILDYFTKHFGTDWNYEKLNQYINSLEKLANEDAIIFIKYVLNYIYESEITLPLFKDSVVSIHDIKDEIFTMSDNSPMHATDAVILRRVKHKDKIDK